MSGLVIAGLYFASWLRGAELMRQGDIALRDNDLGKALVVLDRALHEWLPNRAKATALCTRAVALNRANQFDAALRDLNEALRLGNTTAQVHFERGVAYHSTNRLDDALVEYTAAINGDGNLAAAYLNRAIILMSRQEWTKAIADLTEAIRCEPKMIVAFFNRAACSRHLGDHDAALRDYDSILSAEPQNEKAHAERGATLQARGDLNGTLDSVQQLLTPPAFDPEIFQSGRRPLPTPSSNTPSPLPDLRNNAAWLRKTEVYQKALAAEAMGNYQGALDYYNRLLSLNEGPWVNCAMHMNRGNIYLKLENKDQALVEYNAAIQEEPGNAGAYVDRGRLLGELGQHEGAMADFAVALHLNPGQAQAYYNRALEYLERGEVDAAMADLNKALEFKPDLCEVYVKRAEAFRMKGEVAGDVRDLEFALNTRCRKMVLNALAWRLAMASDVELRDGRRAIELATEQCTETQWKNAACIDTLAAAYAEADDFDSAVEFERRVLTIGLSSYERASCEEHLSLFLAHIPCREYFERNLY